MGCREVTCLIGLSLFGCGGAPPERDAPITIQAYYSGRLVVASYRELVSTESLSSDRVSLLYQSDPGVASGSAFVSVLGPIGGELSPAWREVQVSGNQCAADRVCAVPRQFISAEDLLAAVGAGPEGVHLVATSTHCSVIGVRAVGASSATLDAPGAALLP